MKEALEKDGLYVRKKRTAVTPQEQRQLLEERMDPLREFLKDALSNLPPEHEPDARLALTLLDKREPGPDDVYNAASAVGRVVDYQRRHDANLAFGRYVQSRRRSNEGLTKGRKKTSQAKIKQVLSLYDRMETEGAPTLGRPRKISEQTGVPESTVRRILKTERPK